jgi:RNA polymerase sigma-70 factor (ECF subfamily)
LNAADQDPERDVVMADSVGLALLVVLESLTPPERLAFVLHDVFGMPFGEIAPLVERSSAATRQLASRARRRVRVEAPEPDADFRVQRVVVDAFLAAAREGDFEALLQALDPKSSSASTEARTHRDRSRDHQSLVPRLWRVRQATSGMSAPMSSR